MAVLSSQAFRTRLAAWPRRRVPAWILDNPKAVNQQPAAAKVLASLLDKLHSASARGRRGNLAVVRTMTEKGGG
jgi:hypothetical protein